MRFTDLWPIKPLADQRAVVQGDGYRITVLTDRLLRLEYDAKNVFCDTATQMAICRVFPKVAFTVTESERLLTVETDAVRLEYDKQPFSGTGLKATLKGQFSVYASIWHYGDAPETLKGTARTLDEANGAIVLEEGLMSFKGYAVLDDSNSMRMDENGKLKPAVPHGIDLYLFAYGHDYKACLKDYYHLTGKTPPLPRYALGNWWSRFYPYTQESYQALMEQFEREGVPLSVSVLDMNWHVTEIDPKYGPGWTGYTWDREKFPEPEKLMAWLHEHGLRVTLNDHPADGVRACDDMYPQMAEAMGEDPQSGRPFPFDAADEEYLAAFEKCVMTPFEEAGMDFWWIDWQQKGGSSDPGMDPLFVLNHTRYLHAIRNDHPAVILSRYGGPGSHRYPVGFSGDTFATWASLDFQPYFTSTAANIGYTWWSHDIGGHMHGDKDDEKSLRWVQFGVFSPILRLHSSPSEFMRKEPWTYPGEICRIMKDYLRLRHQLLPWLYTENLMASREGTALLRPMYYDYPNERALYFVCKNQYMLGESMMVCPVTTSTDVVTKLARTEVFLPEGEWIDFFTGMRYAGRQRIVMHRPLESMPVLMKAGSILPMDAAQYPQNGGVLPQTIRVKVYPGASGAYEMIEDNGRIPGTKDYRQAVTRFALEQDERLTVTIAAAQGDASVVPEGRRYIVDLCGVANVLPDQASCAYTADYDEQTRTLSLTLEEGCQTISLTWTNVPPCPVLDWVEALQKLLIPAYMNFDLKDSIMRLTHDCKDKVSFLAQLHLLAPGDAFISAVLELLSMK